MEIKSKSPFETKKTGNNLAKKVLKKRPLKRAIVLALMGCLGGGKTTFLQGFAKGLGVKEKILSPTFVLMKKFNISGNKKFKNFYHFDCYRIKNKKELSDIGLKDILSSSENIVAIEWADKIRSLLPKDKIIIRFYFLNDKKRKIWIKNV